MKRRNDPIFKKLFLKIKTYQRKKSFAKVFFALAKLQEAFFYAYLKEDFLKNQPAYAKLFFKRRIAFFLALKKARDRTKRSTKFKPMIGLFEHLYEILFSMHLLRYRVQDYTIFEICAREFKAISKISTHLLNELGKSLFSHRSLISTDHLLQNIHTLESVYQHTLKIIVRDPIIFIFFIQDLYALSEEIEKSSNLIWQSSRLPQIE